ncbi:MAG: hypothetical protein AAF770_03895 [Bacteroidota bacterium]
MQSRFYTVHYLRFFLFLIFAHYCAWGSDATPKKIFKKKTNLELSKQDKNNDTAISDKGSTHSQAMNSIQHANNMHTQIAAYREARKSAPDKKLRANSLPAKPKEKPQGRMVTMKEIKRKRKLEEKRAKKRANQKPQVEIQKAMDTILDTQKQNQEEYLDLNNMLAKHHDHVTSQTQRLQKIEVRIENIKRGNADIVKIIKENGKLKEDNSDALDRIIQVLGTKDLSDSEAIEEVDSRENHTNTTISSHLASKDKPKATDNLSGHSSSLSDSAQSSNLPADQTDAHLTSTSVISDFNHRNPPASLLDTSKDERLSPSQEAIPHPTLPDLVTSTQGDQHHDDVNEHSPNRALHNQPITDSESTFYSLNMIIKGETKKLWVKVKNQQVVQQYEVKELPSGDRYLAPFNLASEELAIPRPMRPVIENMIIQKINQIPPITLPATNYQTTDTNQRGLAYYLAAPSCLVATIVVCCISRWSRLKQARPPFSSSSH